MTDFVIRRSLQMADRLLAAPVSLVSFHHRKRHLNKESEGSVDHMRPSGSFMVY